MELGDLTRAAGCEPDRQSPAFDHAALVSMDPSAREPIDCRVTVASGRLVVSRRGGGILLSVRLARVMPVDAKRSAIELLVDGTPLWIDFRARRGRPAPRMGLPVRALRSMRGWVVREQFRRALRGSSAPAQWERRARDFLGDDEIDLSADTAGADRGFS